MMGTTNTASFDDGLTHDDYKTRGESGEYRPDLGRYFLPGMKQPPIDVAAMPVSAATDAPAPKLLKTKEPALGKTEGVK